MTLGGKPPNGHFTAAVTMCERKSCVSSSGATPLQNALASLPTRSDVMVSRRFAVLGVRRARVTVAINELTTDGLIGHVRGAITITDPEGLERRACECERVVREGWEPLMKLEP